MVSVAWRNPYTYQAERRLGRSFKEKERGGHRERERGEQGRGLGGGPQGQLVVARLSVVLRIFAIVSPFGDRQSILNLSFNFAEKKHKPSPWAGHHSTDTNTPPSVSVRGIWSKNLVIAPSPPPSTCRRAATSSTSRGNTLPMVPSPRR